MQNNISPCIDGDWREKTLLFTDCGPGVWAVDMPPGSLKASNPRRVATGTAILVGVRGTPTQFVFSSGNRTSHLWTLPLDLNSGKATGPLRPLSHSGGNQSMPASSSDGRLLTYAQHSPAGGEIRIRDTHSGRESLLFAGFARPKISPDGSRVAYSTSAIFIVDSTGGQPRKLIDLAKGGQIYGWTNDGGAIVYYRVAPVRFHLFDLKTGKDQEMISHPTLDVHGAEPSPDRKWVAFHFPAVANSPIRIAPLRDGRAAGESEWLTVAEYPGRNTRPWWSPDGNLLYFLSMKDLYPGIWAQRLDRVTRRPVGEAFAVYRFQETRKTPNMLGAAAFGPAIGNNQITFSLEEPSDNIWIAVDRGQN